MIKDMKERGILTNEMMIRMLGAAVPYTPLGHDGTAKELVGQGDNSHTK
jgi:hypothetical protein